jgi:Ni,Fe-hydrogenase III component G
MELTKESVLRVLAQNVLSDQIDYFKEQSNKTPNAILLRREAIEVYGLDFLESKKLRVVLVEDDHIDYPRLMSISDFRNFK